jgi:hypothetical protein
VNEDKSGELSDQEKEELWGWMRQRNANANIPTGMENAVVGMVHIFPACKEHDMIVPILDQEIVLENLRVNDDMSPEDAVEWFEVNTKGSYMGPSTPAYLEKYGES